MQPTSLSDDIRDKVWILGVIYDTDERNFYLQKS